MQKKIDQKIEFVVNKKANNGSNVSDTKKEKEKQFILKVQYGKHFNTVKHTVEHLNDESNTPLIKAVS